MNPRSNRLPHTIKRSKNTAMPVAHQAGGAILLTKWKANLKSTDKQIQWMSNSR